jgi:hypothetical protein
MGHTLLSPLTTRRNWARDAALGLPTGQKVELPRRVGEVRWRSGPVCQEKERDNGCGISAWVRRGRLGPESGIISQTCRTSLEVAQRRLNLAEVLLNAAFYLQHFITHEPASSFVDRSFPNFHATLHLMPVNAHDVSFRIADAVNQPAGRLNAST